MNDLTPTRNTSLASIITEPRLRALKQLLESDKPGDEVIGEIARNAVALADADRLLPALESQLDEAGDDQVQRVIVKAFALYPQPQRAPEEWSAWWSAYYDVLSGQPAGSLEAGMKAWIRTDQTGFLPKPGQLLTHVRKEAEPIYRSISRARRLARMEPPALEVIDNPDYDPEARKRMAEEVRSLFAKPPVQQTEDYITGTTYPCPPPQ